MPVTIREATAADTADLAPLIRAALAEQAQGAPHRYTPAPDFETQFRRWIGTLFEDPRSVALIATPTEPTPSTARPSSIPQSTIHNPQSPHPPILGFLLASVQKSPPIFQPPEYAMIHHLYVLPDHRHTGIARRLLTEAAQFYTDLRLPQLRVETHATNIAAQHFFESAHFHRTTLSLARPLPQRSNTHP